MARPKDNGGFYCLAHRERVSMSWFSPLLGVAAIRLVPYALPDDLSGALAKAYARGSPESFRLLRARALAGLRVASAFRDRHRDCRVDAANLAAPGLGSRRIERAAERAGLEPDPATFWARSYMADTPAPFSQADATEATKWATARLSKLKEEARVRERRLVNERLPIMEKALVESQVRDAKKVIPALEADLSEPLPPAPVGKLEALLQALAGDPLAAEIDAAP
jgi:hypothetical protein